jgi:hypothetical protein
MKTDSTLAAKSSEDRDQRSRLQQAKAIYAEILNDEKSLFHTWAEIRVRAWKLGGILSGLKEGIGHGKWLFWLGGNFPELSERNAQRCMAFFKANADWTLAKSEEFHGFDAESVRKLMWGYIPEKERPALEGDRKDAPEHHYLTFVNNFSKWDRQVEIGLATMPPLEIFQHEMERPLRRIIEIGGKEWAEAVLRSEK